MTNQTDVVSKFASLIGSKRTSDVKPAAASLVKTDPNDATSRELLMCISKSVAPDAVVCTLPSLDMRKLEENPSTNVLPNVGEHFPMKMAASVLHNAAEASGNTAKAAQVEQKAAQTLGAMSSWTRSSVIYASKAISENAAKSFSSLVESRVKAWTLLLLKHSLTGDASSRKRLLSMLESIIKVDSAQIAFKPLALVGNTGNVEKAPDDPDVILPLIAEVHLIITVHEKKDCVTLKAPGTISATFERLDDDEMGMGLTSVDIGLKTEALLESMVKEARVIVINAVSKATSGSKIDIKALKKNDGTKANQKPNALSSLSPGLRSGFKPSSSSIASSFASSGLLLAAQKKGMYQPSNPRMKAHSSSLKINKILSTSTLQHTRSVQFDNLDPLKAKADDDSKRQKLATTARLTSFKSFGRPHAGDFDAGGGPKNATFANFGGSQKFWGRDGKLASKPMPMLPSETIDTMTSQIRRNANATFDSQKPPIHLSSRGNLGFPRNNRPTISADLLNTAPSSMRRTATEAEVMLLKKMREHKI
mmetsp:Transcript_74/g.178  ORF Transcript_74/g.178 Transcript_74/m.178 type:complete len:535 (+) Transcript_74:190-1794(+)|eukprot:CAMPEP_0197185562 /NCGR_PEP_ID=MMETSP1423-20130617/12210_1 /TAXON_ID=476441 /ORGANISM="Pseudo-nitzschia heimii, Strain UNC1101" /LENGTH=534 /DNA_ID=CAMNT_0042636659 /DNA_START=121 /DNA_END=1725 /DNA_ORIENTATION=-